ncbi:MAG TPA: SDR family oxidoreductase [Puia sp.]
MSKSILIIGAGQGISSAIAEKFGNEGYTIGLINRNSSKGDSIVKNLSDKGIIAFSKSADAADDSSLKDAIKDLKQKLGSIDILLYNAAAIKVKDILSVSSEELMNDFKVNVGAALQSIQILYEELKEKKGAVLITGGGLANYPNPLYGSLSIGKAGLRNLSLQLHERLKNDGIYVGTLTVNNTVSPNSPTHSPVIIAQKFWKLLQHRAQAEIQF